MTFDQTAISAILVCTLALFVWGRWRYDVVAVLSLMAGVGFGVIDPDDAFVGFGNAAVVTVAAVLAISHALGRSGVIDLVGDRVMALARSPSGQRAGLCLLGAFLSGFMNNVGALALLMPVAISAAKASGYSSSRMLMPLSFSTLLGGMLTLIGTPPNLLISQFRAQALGEGFGMFDFTPVGLAVALVGIAFVVTVGWRLIPKDRRGKAAEEESFEVTDYVTELRVGDESAIIGKTVAELERESDDAITIIGIVRNERRLIGRLLYESVRAGDVLMVQSDSDTLQKLVKGQGLELAERPAESEAEERAAAGELMVAEAVITPVSWVQGRTAATLDLRRHWRVNLLALSRQGRPVDGRLRDVGLVAGDVLLLEGDEKDLNEVIASLGSLPLANRKLIFEPRRILVPVLLFAAAIAATSFGLVPSSIAFTATVVALVLVNALRPDEVYKAIDWSVIVLLAAMIPFGQALENTGTAQLIADGVVALAGTLPALALLGIVLVVTMAATPVLNNAATVVIMAPIALAIAERTGVNADPFLIAVAVGASCDFLTPFGHHNNTIIMGPGGYRFTDFARMGAPLEALVIVVALAVIPIVWPF
ncbi:SLC13 family permease [Allomesorhizobium camelthorni]|uniref:SLC13 family permease n=1 Tax=Allomesorhizobium camelthorni TaxID=475069 RepID=A0A6G4WMM2_9HYPH|nr:SLC13 family permease [Mesorhizobium camelthorni]NGO55456.1 SLC13 family permease [Mesorhizobium camelthorni]